MKELENVEQLHNVTDEVMVYIFGAGTYAKTLITYCLSQSMDLCGIVVSNKDDNPSEISALSVMGFEDIDEYSVMEKSVLLVAINDGLRMGKAIEEKYRWKNIFICGEDFFCKLFEKNWSENIHLQRYECVPIVKYGGIEKDFVVLVNKQSNIPLARVHMTTDFSTNGANESLKTQINKQYGDIQYINGFRERGLNKYKSAVVYVAAGYRDLAKIDGQLPNGYRIIQVGAASCKNVDCDISDAEGDNISLENNIYSECSAHYWIWKNDNKHEYVGVNHYRRQQNINDDVISKIENNDIDIVLAMPQFVGGSFKDFYLKYSTEREWNALEEVIEQRRDEYSDLLKNFGRGNLYFPCNILFARKDVFDDYCNYMFSVTFKIRQWFREHKYDERPRYMGYLTEILENLYIMKHKNEYKVGYTDIFFTR